MGRWGDGEVGRWGGREMVGGRKVNTAGERGKV